VIRHYWFGVGKVIRPVLKSTPVISCEAGRKENQKSERQLADQYTAHIELDK